MLYFKLTAASGGYDGLYANNLANRNQQQQQTARWNALQQKQQSNIKTQQNRMKGQANTFKRRNSATTQVQTLYCEICKVSCAGALVITN
jgi:hypothetical protein